MGKYLRVFSKSVIYVKFGKQLLQNPNNWINFAFTKTDIYVAFVK